MRSILIVAVALGMIVAAPARGQLIGQPSGQGGTPPPQPNVSTAPPLVVPTTPGTPQIQDPALQLEGSASESQSPTSPYAPYSPSPRVRALNQLTHPPTAAGQGQAERPAGPLR
jgi:hypothetical protein